MFYTQENSEFIIGLLDEFDENKDEKIRRQALKCESIVKTIFPNFR